MKSLKPRPTELNSTHAKCDTFETGYSLFSGEFQCISVWISVLLLLPRISFQYFKIKGYIFVHINKRRHETNGHSILTIERLHSLPMQGSTQQKRWRPCWCSRQKRLIKIILNWNTNMAAVTSCANALLYCYNLNARVLYWTMGAQTQWIEFYAWDVIYKLFISLNMWIWSCAD